MLSAAARSFSAARGTAAVVAAFLLLACGAAERDRRVDATVFAWLQCQDCLHRQLDRVIALGDTAVPRLRQVLAQGAPRSHDSAYVASLQRLAQRSPSLTPTVIESLRQRMHALYSRRAMLALERMNSTLADRALCLAQEAAPAAAPHRSALDSSVARQRIACR